ncbi:MAG TPA: hypothetical protein VII73_07465 [Caulobacteraceae bacterium]
MASALQQIAGPANKSAGLAAGDDTGDSTQPPDLAKLKRYFTEAEQLTQAARRCALTALDYYDSDQFTREELGKLDDRGQPAIVINRIKPAINGIIGVTERGRSDPRAWPRNPGNEDAADAATDVLRYIADFNRFKRLKRDCFLDMLVPGTCAALVGVDADLQVTITQVRWEEFFHDPRARRADFKDARYLGIAKWMYADDASALYPDKAKAIEATVENGSGGGIMPDESYQDRPLAGPGTGGAWIDRKQRRLMVVEMYYQESGWKRCVFTGTDVLEAARSPYLDHKGKPDCPIEAMSAYVKRDNARYGAAWDMIGPQDEINKRRSKSVHLLSVSRIEVADPSAIDVDADVARKEAARPDGVIPYGWRISPNTVAFQGNMEMLLEAKSEIERMGPSPAVLGRDENDASGRALLARQQSGLIELGNLYSALEDWELRIYRQCWGRVKQYWKAPQFIRVTDDENAPKFVGLNQPVHGGAPTIGADENGMPMLKPGILGYKNVVAEMDVDIEIDAQPDTGTVQQEAYNEILQLVGMSQVYQQQISLKQLLQLSPIPHKRAILDNIDQASQAQQQQADQAHQIQVAGASAKIDETTARTALHHATGFAKTLNALTEAHAMHADNAARGLEQGMASVQQPQQPPPGQQSASPQ